MEFLDPALDAYVVAHTQAETKELNDLNRETHIKVLQARMLSGHLQGRVLSMLSHMIKPKKVLEIGTYTGYSAICIAEGLAEGGMIDTIDINEELEPIVSKYLHLTGNKDKVHMHIGDATEIIPGLSGPYDLVFIDADKTNYIKYFELAFDKVPVGGYIIADNVLWSGKVLDRESIEGDPDTAAIVAYNDVIMKNDKVENVLFPIRDGLMIARKISA